MRDPEKTIGGIIDKQKIAYIASIDADGVPEIRAMLAPRKRDGIKTVWFSTNTSSQKVAQYQKNSAASVYFCDKTFFRGILLKGTMEVMTGAESKEMIWRKGDTMYYPKGITDPDYCVLKFTATSGKYYAALNSKSFDL